MKKTLSEFHKRLLDNLTGRPYLKAAQISKKALLSLLQEMDFKARVAALLPSMLVGEVFLKVPGLTWLYDWIEPVMYNAFRSPLAFAWTLAAVALAGYCIYRFDKWAMRDCDLLTDGEKHKIALTMAVVTAPWMFFIPVY